MAFATARTGMWSSVQDKRRTLYIIKFKLLISSGSLAMSFWLVPEASKRLYCLAGFPDEGWVGGKTHPAYRGRADHSRNPDAGVAWRRIRDRFGCYCRSCEHLPELSPLRPGRCRLGAP